MKIQRGWMRVLAIGLVGATLTAGVGRGQKGGTPQLGQDPTGQVGDSKNKIDMPPFGSPEDKQAKLRNDERQKRLISDTDKLLALATQLHEDVGKTDKNILSLDVVKRADEIEKLAHSVKERMKS
jgi:hypothetical protein